ncbi:MFS transporter [Timonella senegalensis]|uniref:MFS transporter n=1 Tax=Timonella senegalensis TaxID=1465825 RepID=UPI0002DDA94F|nr:MFS transporter [Timonella senegalensis]
MSLVKNWDERLASGPAQPQVSKRTITAWSLWDWGSAAWNAVVTTFVFSTWITSKAFVPTELADAYDTSLVARDQVDSIIATHSTWLSWGSAAAGIAIALLAPILGSRADAGGRRKLWLGINTGVVVVLMAMIFFVVPDQDNLSRNVVFGIVLLGLGNIFFELASVNYNSMLNQITTKENRGRISGIGWGAGYLGGIVLLFVLLVGFINPDVGWFGVTGENSLNIRAALLLSAVWFAVFAIPVFLAVPEKPAEATHKPLGVKGSYQKVIRDVKHLWHNDRQVLRFLFASAIFRDGLAGAFAFGGIIAQGTFGFTASTVIVFAIVANVVSGIATIASGFLEDKIGAKRIIVFSLAGMVISALAIFFLHDAGTIWFWIFGSILCVFVGPIQSASRATVSRMATPNTEGELFGLYAMTGRVVSFLAPAMFGLLVAIFGRQYWGILGLALVLALGLALTLPLQFDRERGAQDEVPAQADH